MFRIFDRIKRLALPLLAAGSLSLVTLVPVSAQSAYPGRPAAGYGMGGAPYMMPRSQAGPGYGYGSGGGSAYANRGYAYGSGYANNYAGRYYRVVRGDTLNRIAARFGVSLNALLAANPAIRNRNLIFAGQLLAIPAYGSSAYGSGGAYTTPRGYTAPSYSAPRGSSGAYQAAGSSNGYATPAAPDTGAATPQATPAAESTSAPEQQSVTIDLAVHNMAFDQSTLTVPAGAHVTVHFNNMDAMPHNLAVYGDRSARQAIFKGQVVQGPNTATYEFDAPSQPGTYFFRCDVHPTVMTGQFIVQ